MLSASSIGVATISLLKTPMHFPPSPLINSSTAAIPNLLANTRSKGVGEPPLCTWPKIVARESKPVYS